MCDVHSPKVRFESLLPNTFDHLLAFIFKKITLTISLFTLSETNTPQHKDVKTAARLYSLLWAHSFSNQVTRINLDGVSFCTSWVCWRLPCLYVATWSVFSNLFLIVPCDVTVCHVCMTFWNAVLNCGQLCLDCLVAFISTTIPSTSQHGSQDIYIFNI